jgi:Protein of unknown function (DUF3891)
MIIRRLGTTDLLITQPDHAALAARILREWDTAHFPDSPRKASILRAIEEHDSGWLGVDETLVVDETSGRLLDFLELPDETKRETSALGVERLAADPYAAALVAQHRLHVYRRYAEHPDWRGLFDALRESRDSYLHAAAQPLPVLLQDYTFVRAGDLASLAFCNQWKETDGDGCGYAMRLEGTSLFLNPDPFHGRTVEIAIDAREIAHQPFASAAEARDAVEATAVVKLKGHVSGAVGGAA